MTDPASQQRGLPGTGVLLGTTALLGAAVGLLLISTADRHPKPAHAAGPSSGDGAEPFDSGPLESGETFTRTFETPGRYGYFCIPHEGARMRGTVVVKPAEDGRSTAPPRAASSPDRSPAPSGR